MRQLILVVLTLAGFLGLGLTQFSSPPTLVHAEMLLATATRTPTPINVGNFVWDDIDHDGRQDAGEPGMAGVTVQLWNSTKTALYDSAVTNANGNYSLTAPLPGNYRVRVLLPNPALDTFSPKDQAGGEDQLDSDINPSGTNLGFTDIYVFASNLISITSIDAGIIKYRTPTPTRTPTPINVGNFVWHDMDGDGIQDAGEPGVSGVTVQLWNSAKNDLLDQTVTNANGNYTLVAPLPGNYRVRVLLPSPILNQFSPKDTGSGANPDLNDSDINPSGTNAGFTDIYVFNSNLISITTIDAGITGSLPPTPTKSPTATATRTRTPTATLTRTPTRTQTPDTSCNKKPAVPVLVSPPDFWQNQNQRMKLNWNDAPCAEFYKVIVRLKFTNGVKVDGAKVTKSKYKTVELTRHKTYHWRIKACNPPYGCSKSPWRRFSIAE